MYFSVGVGVESKGMGKKGVWGKKTKGKERRGHDQVRAVDEPVDNAPSGQRRPAPWDTEAHERIACHLVESLGDPEHVDFYRRVARTVPESAIRDALVRVKDVRGIRRSKGALFTFLIRSELHSRSRRSPRRRHGPHTHSPNRTQ